jgi:retron-type reverse transcriptase
MPLIKSAQLWILNNILYQIPCTDQAHGFIPQRSIVSNAAQHVGKELVLNLDLKDFFPSISFSRVKGLFQSFGYSGQISTLLALLCTEAEVEQVAIDGKKYFVSIGERTLPQGSPCSPAISNLIAYKLDRRLQGIANKWGFVYTRYADDLSFSCGSDNLENFQQLLWSVQEVVKSEGFTVHPEKIHIMRKGSRQEVTGLIVNKQLGIERKELHRFRALLQQIEKTGPAGKTWNGNPNLENSMRGYASFVMMVKPELGIRFMEKIDSIF